MKKSFLVPLVFILHFCIFLFGGSLFIAIWKYLRLANANGAFFSASFMQAVYFFSPIACVIAIFAVFAFLMRCQKHYTPKIFLSITFLLIMFGLTYALLTPFLYSKAPGIEIQIQKQRKQIAKDKDLIRFIETPVFIQEANDAIEPFLNDVYSTYRKSYKNYLMFSGAFFLMIFSFWVCVICTNWKILNFLFMPLFFFLSIFGYNYISSSEIMASLKSFLPFNLNAFYIKMLYFIAIAILFFIFGIILLIVRHVKYGPKKPKRPKRQKRVKPPKADRKARREKKQKEKKDKKTKSKRQPRQSRLKRKKKGESQDLDSSETKNIQEDFQMEDFDNIEIPVMEDFTMEAYSNE